MSQEIPRIEKLSQKIFGGRNCHKKIPGVKNPH